MEQRSLNKLFAWAVEKVVEDTSVEMKIDHAKLRKFVHDTLDGKVITEGCEMETDALGNIVAIRSRAMPMTNLTPENITSAAIGRGLFPIHELTPEFALAAVRAAMDEYYKKKKKRAED